MAKDLDGDISVNAKSTGCMQRRSPVKKQPKNIIDTMGVGIATATAIAISGSDVAAQTDVVPRGFVILDARFRVAKAKLLTDGSLELTFANGATHILSAEDFILLESGTVAIRGSATDALMLIGASDVDAFATSAPTSSASEVVSGESDAELGSGQASGDSAVFTVLGGALAVLAGAADAASRDKTPPDAPVGLTVNLEPLSLSFSAEAGSAATIFNGPMDITDKFELTESSGVFTAIPKTGAFGGDPLLITVTVTDAAGNQSDPSAVINISIDTTAPTAPSAVALEGATLTFAAEAGSTVKILNGSTDVTAGFTITEHPAGSFSAIAKDGAFDGRETLQLTVTVTDTAGNESEPSALIEGAIGSVLRASLAKGLFLEDAFVLTAQDVDGKEVFRIDSDGNFTSD